MNDRTDSHPWFAIRVRSNFERVSSLAMQSKGLEEYVPFVRERRQWSDRLKEIDAPLFPGCVFCRFDPVRRVPRLSCPSVVNIVSFDGHPIPVPDDEMQSVRTLVNSSLRVQPHPFLACGQKVRIENGP